MLRWYQFKRRSTRLPWHHVLLWWTIVHIRDLHAGALAHLEGTLVRGSQRAGYRSCHLDMQSPESL